MPLAVWSEGDKGQGNKKCHEVEEALSQGAGRRQPLSCSIYYAAWPLCNFLGSQRKWLREEEEKARDGSSPAFVLMHVSLWTH